MTKDKSPHSGLMPLAKACSDFEASWRQLVIDNTLNPTLSPNWVLLVAEARGITGDSFVFIDYENARPSSFVPIVRSRILQFGIPLNTIDLVTNFVAYHNDLVVSRPGNLVISKMLDSDGIADWDFFRMSALTDSSVQIQSLSALTDNGHLIFEMPAETSPYLPIKSDWDTFVQSKNKKFRYKLRKRSEQLEQSAQLKMVWFDSRSHQAELTSAICEIESNSWKAREGTAITSNAQEQRYSEMIIDYMAKNDMLAANVLLYEQAPIAYCLCCRWRGWVGQLKTSFDQRFSALSPGALVIDGSIRNAFDIGCREYDFLGEADQHKLFWTKNVRSHHDLFIYNGRRFRARIAAQLKKLTARSVYKVETD